MVRRPRSRANLRFRVGLEAVVAGTAVVVATGVDEEEDGNVVVVVAVEWWFEESVAATAELAADAPRTAASMGVTRWHNGQ